MTGFSVALVRALRLTHKRIATNEYRRRCQSAINSGQGCSLWSSRLYSNGVKDASSTKTSSEGLLVESVYDTADDVGFMEDDESEVDAEQSLPNEGTRLPETDSLKGGSAPVTESRPKLPRSIKKLNRALGRKQTIEIPDHELIEQFVRGRGPGGQAINKTNSSVSLIHVPTGIRIQSQPTRSREQNRIAARHILSERLDELRTQGLYTPASPTKSKRATATPNAKHVEEKALAEAYTKSELRAAKERSRKLNRAKKQRKKKRLSEESQNDQEEEDDS